jgi:hypothetical protein
MKSNKRFVFYICAVLIFILYLFSANYIFNVLIRTDREARRVKISLPPETQIVRCNVEEVRKENLQWKEGVLLRGWVCKSAGTQEKREAYIVLRSENELLIFDIENDRICRPDVMEYFKLDYKNAYKGFEVVIPVYCLKDDAYRIGFIIEDTTGSYYSLSNFSLNPGKGVVSVIGSDPEIKTDTIINSSIQSFTLKQQTNDISYNVEKVTKTGEFLTVSGWGFLQWLDTKNIKSYVLLKQSRNVHVFSVNVQSRKDVTDCFASTKLNLDSSGFQTRIPTASLKKGNYRVGLYLEKGNKTGMVYTDKFVEIAE